MKKLKYIHIGKCGGTFIRDALRYNIDDYYHVREGGSYKKNEEYIIWIRNPIDRFVSAFWYSYNVINFNTDSIKVKDLNIKNSLYPEIIKSKINNNREYTYSRNYDRLINYFGNPNYLAESLTSNDKEIRDKAHKLMNNKIEHIYKGIGWYLKNGKFIEKNHDKIVFVGRQEYTNLDLKKLSSILSKPVVKSVNKIRKNKNNNSKYLSPLAVNNIINFYKDTDYAALKMMLKYKLINKKTYNEYQNYENSMD